MNRLENTSAGPIIDKIKDVLSPIFSKRPKIVRTAQSIKLIYSYQSIIDEERKLKIEINIKETLPQKALVDYPFEVISDFFTGSTSIRGFCKEEMIGTKIRALYQRKKGRDLFDLYELGKLKLNWKAIIESFQNLNIGASREDFERNMDEKIKDSMFRNDIAPLLPSNVKAEYNIDKAYEWFKKEILSRL
jgi:predicted nucleotidyltransferase component of viral defense system